MADIKKQIVNIILAVISLFIILLIALGLIAEISFNLARKAESSSRMYLAESRCRQAIRLNPFNAQYHFWLGRFLYAQCAQKPCVINAQPFIEKAIKLDPANPDYYLELGLMQLAAYRAGRGKGKKEWLDNFKRAFQRDPNGFNVSYKAGYAGLSVWRYLEAQEKDFILERLKFCLKLKPWYAEYIYPRLWDTTGDSGILKKVKPEISSSQKQEKIKRIEEFKRNFFDRPQASGKVLPSDWQGVADDARNVYPEGNMFWGGTVYAFINAPAGNIAVKIKAKGQSAEGIWPHMIVYLDSQEIGEAFAETGSWKEYIFKAESAGGLKVLSITFANDYYKGKEDRNLFIGEASVAKEE